MASGISGKLMAFTVNGKKYKCQTTGNIALNKEISTDEPCKDDGGWNTGTVTSKGWTGSFAAKAFLESIVENGNQLDIIELMIESDDPVELEFLTTPGDHNYPVDVTLAGEAYLNGFNWEAAANANSTYTVDFTGNGPLALDKIPKTT